MCFLVCVYGIVSGVVYVVCVLDCVGIPEQPPRKEGICCCTTGEHEREKGKTYCSVFRWSKRKSSSAFFNRSALFLARGFPLTFFPPSSCSISRKVGLVRLGIACASRNPAKYALADIGPSNAVMERLTLVRTVS